MLKQIKFLLCFFVASVTFAQTNQLNYTVTHSYREEAKTELELENLSDDDIITDVMYYDGLGREMQSISLRAGGTKKDIITLHEYDKLGRKAKTFLPYSDNRTNINYRWPYAYDDFYSYYKLNFPEEVDGETINPYSETHFEASPLNRVLEQGAPGIDWKVEKNKDTDHTVKFSYLTNTDSDLVRIYEVLHPNNNTEEIELTETGMYQGSTLVKTIVKDENWTPTSENNHTTQEFKNKQGQVILKRNYNNNEQYDTYYVYDDYGNLTYVLPPKCNASTVIPTISILNKLAYQYIYDYRNRLVEKQLPGKSKEAIIYDNLDRPILTQDGNLKAKKQWLFTKYDVFGRVIYTGVYTDGLDRERQLLQNYVTSLVEAETDPAKRAKLFYETRVSTGEGTQGSYYTNNNFPKDAIEIVQASYYDKQLTSSSKRENGLLTATRVKLIGTTNDWEETLFSYNDKGQVINESSFIGYNSSLNFYAYKDVSYTYNFAGQVIKKVTKKNTPSGEGFLLVQVNDLYKYDNRNRLVRHNRCIGEQPSGLAFSDVINGRNFLKTTEIPNCEQSEIVLDITLKENINVEITEVTNLVKEAENSITLLPGFEASPLGEESLLLKIDENSSGELIAAYTYDAIGQQIVKKIGNHHSSPLQTINYNYNVRGWLTKINNDNISDNDLFNATLHYNNPLPEGTPLYNGNISSMSWNTKNTDSGTKVYNYNYDALNRITAALHSDFRYSVSGITYDKNGNIETLNRKGYNSTNAATSLMDKLSYTYDANSNKLTRVDDAGTTDPNHGFKAASSTYTYDVNGNIKSDTGKGITSISYNYLNLPEQINFNTGKFIEYTYDALGVKKSKIIKEQNGSALNSTLYLGEFLYSSESSNGLKLDIIQHPEGYTDRNEVINQESEFNYFFNHKDHLGNIRLTFGDEDGSKNIEEDEIVQENNYYPFGLQHKGYNNVVNGKEHPYKYNGKEHQDELGLDWYDLGARNHDPALGRFMNVDPLAEDYYFQSTYAFAANNPIYFIDINGEGVLNDYGIDKKTGNITLIKETNERTDTLYAGSGEGDSFVKDESKGSVTVDQYQDRTSLISDLSSENTVTHKWLNQDDIEESRDINIARTPNGYGKEAYNVFKFAADNSNVEWSLQSYTTMPGSIEYQVGTYHEDDRSPTLSYSFGSIMSEIHSHPNQPTKKDRDESLWGDKNRSISQFKKYGNNVGYYIYFPNTGKTSQIRYRGEEMGRHNIRIDNNRKVKL